MWRLSFLLNPMTFTITEISSSKPVNFSHLEKMSCKICSKLRLKVYKRSNTQPPGGTRRACLCVCVFLARRYKLLVLMVMVKVRWPLANKGERDRERKKESQRQREIEEGGKNQLPRWRDWCKADLTWAYTYNDGATPESQRNI